MSERGQEAYSVDADLPEQEGGPAGLQPLQEQLIRALLRVLIVLAGLLAIVGTLDSIDTDQVWTIPFYWGSYALLVAATVWRKASYRFRVWTVIGLLYTQGVIDLIEDGPSGSARVFLLGACFLAAMLLSRWEGFGILGTIALTFAVFGVLFVTGVLEVPNDLIAAEVGRWVTGTLVLLLVGLMMVMSAIFMLPRLDAALGQSQSLTLELSEERAGLERTVSERTAALARRAAYLEATATVAREAAGSLGDPQALLERVAQLVSERFGFYHTGIFIVDETREWAELSAASSEGGRRMLSREHRLRVGAQGIVGDVAARGRSRIALDVGVDAAFFDNPDLPDTRSEMALPLRVGERVIGVLDVQSTEAEAFTEEDSAVLQSLADQIAVAIENSRLYRQMEDAAEAERRARGEASRRTWEAYLAQRANLGFVKEGRTVRALEDAASAAQRERVVAVPVHAGNQEVAVIEVPFSEAQATWTAEQVSMLEALADQVGQALTRAQLYESTERTATRERVISESAAQIRASLDMETVLQTAVREVAESLGIDQAEIRLGTGPTHKQV